MPSDGTAVMSKTVIVAIVAGGFLGLIGCIYGLDQLLSIWLSPTLAANGAIIIFGLSVALIVGSVAAVFALKDLRDVMHSPGVVRRGATEAFDDQGGMTG